MRGRQEPHPGEDIDRTYVSVVRQSGFRRLHHSLSQSVLIIRVQLSLPRRGQRTYLETKLRYP